ncbi:putative Acyl-CoA synthetase family member 4 [Heracleum sosnowskyi]|uniref:Acyl-CoA synthetase family member 4 n=1 Tax=Heracleum sosnowskyi TaxID=360622 RepID=A0AAD8MMX2_9APIA|nr:putative Acyl-CoA synthetase family member 4 [Heracleum sosnowskyi]
MSAIQEITNLFASLALNLNASNQVSESVDNSIDLSITKFNQSLNFNQHSRVRVLDTALSLMCFTSPQVFDSVIEYSVKTIVAVLGSSINCKVIQCDDEAVLSIGGLISSRDVVELVETCGDILGKLKARGVSNELPGNLGESLLRAVLRVVVSASSFRHVRELGPVLDARPGDGRTLALSELLQYVPKEMSVKKGEIPLRSMIWYLDPLILKNDVSQILQESINRPFLCLDTEFFERIEWRSTILSLAFSPCMFIETRSLLHNWFLLTGLASLLEFQIKLVSLVLDIISRPMRWGILADVILTLPSSHAYFPYNHQFVRILAGPLTCGGLLQLVHNLSKSHFRSERCSTNQAATKSSLVDHKSLWAMAMNFPDWFYFSCVLLFLYKSSGDNFPSTSIFGAALTQHTEEAETLCSAAARYIAWILNPIGKSHQDVVAQNLRKMAGNFTSKQYGLAKHTNPKKLKRQKLHNDVHGKEYDCQIIRLWIQDFQDMYSKHIPTTVNSSVEGKTAPNAKLGQAMLFRRISLGILIGCSDNIKEDGWELLLHYSATGMILQSTNTNDTGLQHKNRKSMDGSIAWTEKSDKKEVEKGACLVFYLTDVVENMSITLIDSEENGSDLICQVKSKASKYLLKCVHKLLNSNVREDYALMLLDLRNRLIRWSHQGKAVFQGSKDVGDTIETISKILSSL